jgi:hypothetical protein
MNFMLKGDMSANSKDKLAEKCRQALEKSYGMEIPMPKRKSERRRLFKRGVF